MLFNFFNKEAKGLCMSWGAASSNVSACIQRGIELHIISL